MSKTSKTKQTFETALSRLEEIVAELESGELPLDHVLSKFEEGIKLSGFCSRKLDETEKKITMLLKDHEGKVSEKPFTSDADDTV